ncbi:MAG: hypothetical protein LM550_11115 [Candidatus Contendobacter sp.]|jgi:hypothetical protein|nr:hypothetical protein [Gammaproteobacteria bacterium]MCC8994213.1 hypothetical protein [Candidatus Contendobacter sp.]
MTYQKLLDEYIALPLDAQRQVADFISFLQQRYVTSQPAHKNRQADLTKEPFIGMWRNRQDLLDSSDWVRKTRKSEWGEKP